MDLDEKKSSPFKGLIWLHMIRCGLIELKGGLWGLGGMCSTLVLIVTFGGCWCHAGFRLPDSWRCIHREHFIISVFPFYLIDISCTVHFPTTISELYNSHFFSVFSISAWYFFFFLVSERNTCRHLSKVTSSLPWPAVEWKTSSDMCRIKSDCRKNYSWFTWACVAQHINLLYSWQSTCLIGINPWFLEYYI